MKKMLVIIAAIALMVWWSRAKAQGGTATLGIRGETPQADTKTPIADKQSIIANEVPI